MGSWVWLHPNEPQNIWRLRCKTSRHAARAEGQPRLAAAPHGPKLHGRGSTAECESGESAGIGRMTWLVWLFDAVRGQFFLAEKCLELDDKLLESDQCGLLDANASCFAQFGARSGWVWTVTNHGRILYLYIIYWGMVFSYCSEGPWPSSVEEPLRSETATSRWRSQASQIDMAVIWVNKASKGSTEWCDTGTQGQLWHYGIRKKMKPLTVLIKTIYLGLAFFEIPSWCLNPHRSYCLEREGLYSWNIPELPFQAGVEGPWPPNTVWKYVGWFVL